MASTRKLYLLDANILAAVFLGRKGAVTLVDPWITNGDAATSILVYGEVIEYAMGFANYASRQADLQALLQVIPVHPVNYTILEQYAMLRRAMRKPHGPGLIGDIDTLIAATALQHNMTLVTTDGDFTRVPDLQYLLLPLSAIK